MHLCEGLRGAGGLAGLGEREEEGRGEGGRGDWGGRPRWQRTFVLWMTDSGTMGLIWSSRSDNMIVVFWVKAKMW